MMNAVIIKGIHLQDVESGDIAVVMDKYLPHGRISEASEGSTVLGCARIFEVKHMVMVDLKRYPRILKLYHDEKCRTYMKIRNRMGELYEGFIDGEIVTLVLFTPNQDLIDGTTAETTDSQGPEQAEA